VRHVVAAISVVEATCAVQHADDLFPETILEIEEVCGPLSL
jgi:hypothetical protein